MSAISDDIDDYLGLCREYNETPVSCHGSPDCYGAHAKSLKKRKIDELEAKRVREVNSSPEVRMMKKLLGRLTDGKQTRIINEDPSLKDWWKKNRADYDREKKRQREQKKRKTIIDKAKKKLTSKERMVLGVK